MNRTCPDCNVSLASRDFYGINVDTCPKCAGIFFDDGEVAEVKALGLSAMDELEAAVLPTVTIDATEDRLRRCSACGTLMDKFRYMYNSNVVLDECGQCGGIWVQDGELSRMREVLADSGVLDKPRSVTVVWATQEEKKEPPRESKLLDFIRSVGRKFQGQSA